MKLPVSISDSGKDGAERLVDQNNEVLGPKIPYGLNLREVEYMTSLKMQLTMESVRGIMSKVVTKNKHTEQTPVSRRRRAKRLACTKQCPALRRLFKTGIIFEQLILGLDCQVALNCNLVGQSKKAVSPTRWIGN